MPTGPAAVSGLVIVPCSPLLQASGLRTLLDDAGVKLVITEQQFEAVFGDIMRELPSIRHDCLIATDVGSNHPVFQSLPRLMAVAPSHRPANDIQGDDPFNIMYSSGTTGLPKGIIHSHCVRSLYGTLFANAWRMTPESVVLHAGSIVFNGAMLDLMPWMYLGCRYILHRSFDAERVIEDIHKHAVTHIVMVPAQIIQMLGSPAFDPEKLQSLEMVHNVGAPLHAIHKQRINQVLPNRYYELYGVTEGFMTILDRRDAERKMESVGMPMSFNEIKVVNSEGQVCPVGEIGEICGRGPLLMSGYHNNPEKTAEAIRDGWMHSGDLGYLDEDGYLYLVDRQKDMIISGGVNVYPKDIEEVVIQMPEVREVAVFGVADARWGEVPVAAVITDSKDAEGIRDWVNQRVHAKFQRLSEVWILEEFPRNVAGKVLKRELRERWGDNG